MNRAKRRIRPGGQVIRVVVVDDDEDVREALTDLLGAEPDIEVVATCPDGHEARECVANVPCDVAVVDVRMPGGGADLVRDLRAGGTGVVCFSADLGTRDEMVAAGAVDFLVKGDRLTDLAGAVRRACLPG